MKLSDGVWPEHGQKIWIHSSQLERALGKKLEPFQCIYDGTGRFENPFRADKVIDQIWLDGLEISDWFASIETKS